jgi:hypothetical protein
MNIGNNLGSSHIIDLSSIILLRAARVVLRSWDLNSTNHM